MCWRAAWIHAQRNSRWCNMPKTAWLGGLLTGFYVVLALGGAAWAPVPPDRVDLEAILNAPSAAHPMGTDHLGRDVLSRLIAGARTTLGLAALVAALSSLAAILLGGLGGFAGGWMDAFLMRLVDAVLALPGFLLAVCLLGLLGGGWLPMVLLLSAVGWAPLARIIRNEAAVVRSLDFVTANRAAGFSLARNLLFHVLPHILPSMLILLLNAFLADVFAIVSLSFLGLGISPQIPEWGAVLYDGRSYFFSNPWLLIFPSLAIAGLALGLHAFADGIREYCDNKKLLFTHERLPRYAAADRLCASDPT